MGIAVTQSECTVISPLFTQDNLTDKVPLKELGNIVKMRDSGAKVVTC